MTDFQLAALNKTIEHLDLAVAALMSAYGEPDTFLDGKPQHEFLYGLMIAPSLFNQLPKSWREGGEK